MYLPLSMRQREKIPRAYGNMILDEQRAHRQNIWLHATLKWVLVVRVCEYFVRTIKSTGKTFYSGGGHRFRLDSNLNTVAKSDSTYFFSGNVRMFVYIKSVSLYRDSRDYICHCVLFCCEYTKFGHIDLKIDLGWKCSCFSSDFFPSSLDVDIFIFIFIF